MPSSPAPNIRPKTTEIPISTTIYLHDFNACTINPVLELCIGCGRESGNHMSASPPTQPYQEPGTKVRFD